MWGLQCRGVPGTKSASSWLCGSGDLGTLVACCDLHCHCFGWLPLWLWASSFVKDMSHQTTPRA